MNKYVQEYLEKRNSLKKEKIQKHLFKIMNNLRIGEKEYPENSEYSRDDYPYWDADERKYYRYNAGEISEEEYKLLVQESNDEPQYIEKSKRSNWYGFATVIMVISGIGLLILALISLGEENSTYFLIGLGEFLMVSLFCGIMQLLAGIKQGIDNLQNK